MATNNNNGYNEFVFYLSNGAKTETGAREDSKVDLSPPGSQISKVIIWHGSTTTVGLEMLNKEGKTILKVGEEKLTKAELTLEDGERIVGVESRLLKETAQAHCSLTFIIGWME